ncbi:MAG: hypothetical protein ABSC93_23540 [Bryobacteraceae bacterium]
MTVRTRWAVVSAAKTVTVTKNGTATSGLVPTAGKNCTVSVEFNPDHRRQDRLSR